MITQIISVSAYIISHHRLFILFMNNISKSTQLVIIKSEEPVGKELADRFKTYGSIPAYNHSCSLDDKELFDLIISTKPNCIKIITDGIKLDTLDLLELKLMEYYVLRRSITQLTFVIYFSDNIVRISRPKSRNTCHV